MRVCPECGGAVYIKVAYEAIHMLRDPPAQVERYIRRTAWQCLRVQAHTGTWVEAAEVAPSTTEQESDE